MRATLRIDIRVHARVPVGRLTSFLAGHVGREVGQHQERIVVQQIVRQRAEQLRVAAAEDAVGEQSRHCASIGWSRSSGRGS